MAQSVAPGADVPARSSPEQAQASSRASWAKRFKNFVHQHLRLLLVAAVVVVLLAIGAVFLLRYLASFESTDDAEVDADISTAGARVAGTVIAVHVEDNDPVTVGAPLVDLDPTDYRVALEGAEATLQHVKDQGVANRAGARIAQRDLARDQWLIKRGAATPELVDTETSTADARVADVRAARSAVLAQEAAVEQARLALGYTHITAPVAGIVGQKQVNVGDRVQAGQELLAIVQVQGLWITANFKETQLQKMHPGQRAEVHVDALDRTFRGHVESMPGASGARFSLFPPENATGNYVKVVQRMPVRIRLEPGQPDLDRLRPGMSVEPKVWIR